MSIINNDWVICNIEELTEEEYIELIAILSNKFGNRFKEYSFNEVL